jgi:hypothetical protein
MPNPTVDPSVTSSGSTRNTVTTSVGEIEIVGELITAANIERRAIEVGDTPLVIHWRVPQNEIDDQFAETLKGFAAKYPNIIFGTLMIDKQAEMDLADDLAVDATPTLQILRQNINLFQEPGVMSPEGLTVLFNESLKLDMIKAKAMSDKAVAELEKELAAHKQEGP